MCAAPSGGRDGPGRAAGEPRGRRRAAPGRQRTKAAAASPRSAAGDRGRSRHPAEPPVPIVPGTASGSPPRWGSGRDPGVFPMEGGIGLERLSWQSPHRRRTERGRSAWSRGTRAEVCGGGIVTLPRSAGSPKTPSLVRGRVAASGPTGDSGCRDSDRSLSQGRVPQGAS